MVQTFTKETFREMDAMHDCYITDFSIEGKTFVVTYDNLDEGPHDSDGEPIYKHKKLVIRYDVSCCDVIWRSKKKWDFIDFHSNPEAFHKMFDGFTFFNNKYSIDCFGEIMLNLTAYKLKKGKNVCSKLYNIDILLDPKTITYTWE